MMQETNLFPEEIQRAVLSLADENRQKIVSVLMKNKEIPYTLLKDSVKLTSGNLNHHLSDLIKAGLITKYLRNKEKEPFESFYTISDFGRDFVLGVFESLKPVEPTRASYPEKLQTLRQKVFGLQRFDLVQTDPKMIDGMRRECKLAKKPSSSYLRETIYRKIYDLYFVSTIPEQPEIEVKKPELQELEEHSKISNQQTAVTRIRRVQ